MIELYFTCFILLSNCTITVNTYIDNFIMAQSNESNVRGIPSFWPNHTLELAHSWTQWNNQFQLATIAKENLDIDSLNRPEVPEMQFPILEQTTGSESDKNRASRET